ncbi:MAG: CNNM domain-containing protein [Bacteriovoracia bacterium]
MEEILLISGCLALNALLAAAEMAFVTARKARLRGLEKAGNPKATQLLRLREKPERTLSVIQIGITLVGAVAAATGGAGAGEFISPIFQSRLGVSRNVAEFLSVAVVVVPLTFFSVVMGELVPKALALRNPVGIALKAAPYLAFLDRFFSSVVSILEWSTKKTLQIFFRKSVSAARPAEPEPIEVADLSEPAKEYVLNLVNLEKRRVKDVYLSWESVVTVRTDQDLAEVEAVVVSSGHTRLPVLEANEVIGIINTKEFMALRRAGQADWRLIIRPAVKVQKSASLISALRQMQQKRSHLSIVYSQTQRMGIVTIEDILEEVIGDVYDEDDDGAIRRILSLGSRFKPAGGRD